LQYIEKRIVNVMHNLKGKTKCKKTCFEYARYRGYLSLEMFILNSFFLKLVIWVTKLRWSRLQKSCKFA